MMNLNFLKTVIVVPTASDSQETYLSILKSLKEPAFRDFLRVKISEKASMISKVISTNGKSDSSVCVMAGEMEFCKYLLGQAVSEMEAILKTEEKKQIDSSVQTRFLSKGGEGKNEEDQISINNV